VVIWPPSVFIEENEIEIIGENTPRKIDVRILAATNQNLEKLISEGKFREDLYYRLNVIKINIPPLRERPEDIIPLAYHFLKEFSDIYNKQIIAIKNQAETLLIHYDWPGNVRQLRNTMEKLVLYGKKKEIGYEETLKALELGQARQQLDGDEGREDTTTLKDAIHEFEKRYILLKLQKHQGKISETARSLGIDRSNLFKKMRRYDINPRNKTG